MIFRRLSISEHKSAKTPSTHKAICIGGICCVTSSFITADGASIAFNGNKHEVIKITPDRKTGLDAVYVLNDTKGSSITFESDNHSEAGWFRFNNLGGAFAEPIDDVKKDGNMTIVENIKDDCGYIIKDGNKSYYFWIINYANHKLDIQSLYPSNQQECDATILDFSGDASAIYYYTINGQREILSREISLEYSTLEWNQEIKQIEEKRITDNLSYLAPRVSLFPTIYCATDIVLSGDRFLKKWGMDISIKSDVITPHSVDVYTDAIQSNSSNDSDNSSNIINNNTEGLGGSAPVDISFRSFVTDAVVHFEWQMATDPEFENITYRFYEQDLNYEFLDEGTTYVRFIGSNSDGSCESYGETYIVNIGNSELRIPNAFSPGNDGINDIWKVGYRSIVDFKCWIFDRQGHEIFYFDNPSDGWNGMYRGKFVKPGVYFYVIQATGADGKRYKKSGDINILRHKENRNSTNNQE